MLIVHRYVTKDFLIGFFMTVALFTFVMCVATVVRAIDLMARGVSGTVVLKAFVYVMPYLLSFSIPMGVIVAALLLFSRLSYDGELTAMRASGLSLWQIVAPLIVLSFLLAGVCLYINTTLSPQSHFARRMAIRNLDVKEPINLLDEGRFVREFPGLMIYVGKKKRNTVQDIVVYELGPEGIKRHVRAASGEVTASEDKQEVRIDLYDVHIEQYDKDAPRDPSKTRRLSAKRYPVRLDLREILRKGSVEKRRKDYTFAELLPIIRDPRSTYPHLHDDDLSKMRIRMLVAANKQLVLSMSCISFMLLGIPLGMRSRRRESSIGIGISLVVVLVFYIFVVVAESLTESAHLRPEVIMWIPVVVSQVVGVYLMRRIN